MNSNLMNFILVFHFDWKLSIMGSGIRATNESSSSELGYAQVRLMKIRVKSSRACEMLRAENLAQTQLVTIRASSRAKTCAVTRFNI
jgi:hypothetical protein